MSLPSSLALGGSLEAVAERIGQGGGHSWSPVKGDDRKTQHRYRSSRMSCVVHTIIYLSVQAPL